MLTVKHVDIGGHESITLAETVIFDPAVGKDNEYPAGQVVAFGVPAPISDGCNRYSSGRVFVMNDFGKTVAVYRLLETR
jgi:hypothetical protein